MAVELGASVHTGINIYALVKARVADVYRVGPHALIADIVCVDLEASDHSLSTILISTR